MIEIPKCKIVFKNQDHGYIAVSTVFVLLFKLLIKKIVWVKLINTDSYPTVKKD